MKEIIGACNKILEIDVTAKTAEPVTVSANRRSLFLGGKGLGLKLLLQRMEPGVDPLGPDNMFAVMTGVLAGTGAPNSSRFAAVTKSPLTGIFTSSSCGGPFGIALKTTGWDGIIIKGQSRSPIYLVITPEGVTFKAADHLMGQTTSQTQRSLSKEGAGALVIGPAGENRVRLANIASGQRFLGRGGMGAVLGAKGIKAVVAVGNEYQILPKNKKEFIKISRLAGKYIRRNPMTSVLYHNYGTAANVTPCNKAKILPVRNFVAGSSHESFRISGEFYKKNFDASFHSCKYCGILCGHKGVFGGRTLKIPEYETVGMLGSNLQIFDPVKIAEWNDICDQMGMDTISVGGTLAWAMEAAEKKLVTTDLTFGSPERISETLVDIAYGSGFGELLGNGSRYLSRRFGGAHFTMQVKGLEIGAYDPRGSFGMGLNYAVANRGGCHLSTALFAPETFFNLLNPASISGKHTWVKFFENLYSAINSLHTCQFTTFAYTLETPLVKFTPHPLLAFTMQHFPTVASAIMDIDLYPKLWSSVTGIPMSRRQFLKAGERIHVMERLLNTGEGISRKDDTLPGRFTSEIRRDDHLNLMVPLDKMLTRYYKTRGYDANGIPTPKTIKKLKILDS